MSTEARDPVTNIVPGDHWLVLVAHPDDETFGCGSLIADAARRGATVTVVCATRGEAGERTELIDPHADLAEVRTAELHAAARLLGATSVELLHYADSDYGGEPPKGSLCAAPEAEVTGTIAAVIGRVGPTVVAALDASDGHRDHARIRTCTRAALSGPGAPEAVLVEVALPNHLMRRWLDEMRKVHPDAPYLSIDPAAFGTPDALITDTVDHSEVLSRREQAIALHRSQRSPFEDLGPDLRRAFLADTHLIRVARSAPIGCGA